MRPLKPASLVVAGIALVIGYGCSDAPTALSDDLTEPIFRVVSGNDQTGVVGQELPDVLVAKLTDGDGNPRVGYVVNWVIIEGGGSVWAPATMTDDKGKTKNRWTLGPEPGTNVVEVRSMAPSGKKRKHGTFNATAPVSLSIAVAQDKGGNAGPERGDQVLLTFDGDVALASGSSFDQAAIDACLPLSEAKTWGIGVSAAASQLSVTLTLGDGATVEIGTTVTVTGDCIEEAASGVPTTGSATIGGSFDPPPG